MELTDKTVLVIGMGKTGESAVKFLHKHGAKAACYDCASSPIKAQAACYDDKMRGSCRKLKNKQFNFAVISPGVAPSSKAVKFCKKNGISMLPEIELAAAFCKAKIIGITGTSGKTTTTSLVAHILNSSGRRAIACGNIGVPFTEVAESLTENDYAVVELSSFMLEQIGNITTEVNFKCHVALFLNFSGNHLDRHKIMENYFNAKAQIINLIKEGGTFVFNGADEQISRLAQKTAQAVNFAEYQTGQITTKLIGAHNLENIKAGVAAAELCGVNLVDMKAALETFEPVPHRLSLVRELNGVQFVNDSKATTVSASLASVKSFNKPVVLILGGSSKRESFAEFFCAPLPNLKAVIAYGATRKAIKRAACAAKFAPLIICEKFSDAVLGAFKAAKSGDVVLLAPACASFDQFKNFEARGQKFEEIVRHLANEEG